MGGWDCTVGPRSGPITVGPRSGPDRGPTQSGPDVNCTKLVLPRFAIDTVAIRMLRENGVEL